MKKILILILISFFTTSCISTKKIKPIDRSILLSKHDNIKPFKQILVQWKNYPYSEYHKIENLETENKKIIPVEVEEKDYKKFKKMVKKIFRENNLYDEVNGTGTVKILLLSSGRWSYSELFSTYLVDTSYIFILPSSLEVRYLIHTITERDNEKHIYESTAAVKTTFHLIFFPFYPLFPYGSAEKAVLKTLIYNTVTDIISGNEIKSTDYQKI